MPIYQYACAECDHRLEALRKISDPPLTECPRCGAEALQKQLTAAAFKLKGTGWYETDFKQSGKPANDKSGDTGDSAGAKKDGDAKGASKSGADGSVSAAPEKKPKAAAAENAAQG